MAARIGEKRIGDLVGDRRHAVATELAAAVSKNLEVLGTDVTVQSLARAGGFPLHSYSRCLLPPTRTRPG